MTLNQINKNFFETVMFNIDKYGIKDIDLETNWKTFHRNIYSILNKELMWAKTSYVETYADMIAEISESLNVRNAETVYGSFVQKYKDKGSSFAAYFKVVLSRRASTISQKYYNKFQQSLHNHNFSDDIDLGAIHKLATQPTSIDKVDVDKIKALEVEVELNEALIEGGKLNPTRKSIINSRIKKLKKEINDLKNLDTVYELHNVNFDSSVLFEHPSIEDETHFDQMIDKIKAQLSKSFPKILIMTFLDYVVNGYTPKEFREEIKTTLNYSDRKSRIILKDMKKASAKICSELDETFLKETGEHDETALTLEHIFANFK